MNIVDTLKFFMTQPAPSGYEKEMAYSLKSALAPLADEISIDRLGNVIAKIRGTDASSPAVMVYAHMDQPGFIVRKIEPDGYLQLDRLGGIPEKVLPGLNLVIRSEDERFHPGVIGSKSHHATPPEEKYKVDAITSLYIDIGANTADQVRKAGIEIGCPAVYRPSFERLQGSRICGTAVDNRGGCAALVRIASYLKQMKPVSDIYLVGTVWEEFNLRGAMIAARTVKPEIAICLDVALSGDTPDLKSRFEAKLGAGPSVLMYSFHGRGTLNGTLPQEGIVKLALSTAKDAGITLQRFAAVGILTDSSYLQLENMGIVSVELGFPTRYTHSPIEVCDVKDIEDLSRLVSAMVCKIDKSFCLQRY